MEQDNFKKDVVIAVISAVVFCAILWFVTEQSTSQAASIIQNILA